MNIQAEDKITFRDSSNPNKEHKGTVIGVYKCVKELTTDSLKDEEYIYIVLEDFKTSFTHIYEYQIIQAFRPIL